MNIEEYPLEFRAYHTVNNVMMSHKEIPVMLKNAKSDSIWKYMLFTGLLDMDGQKIFQGDILAFHTVKNFQDNFVYPFAVTWDIKNGAWVNFSPKNKVKVIGNIHQNPELLCQ